MQTAVNRDAYVDIMWDNIDPIVTNLFLNHINERFEHIYSQASGNFIHFQANTSMFGTDYD